MVRVKAARKAQVIDRGPDNPSRRLRMMDPVSGLTLHLPYLPAEIEESGLAHRWDQLDRPKRRPLLQQAGKALPVQSFTARLKSPGARSSVADYIAGLKSLRSAARPVRLDLAGSYRGLFRVTGLTVREKEWGRNGAPVDAEADVQLTTASDAAAAVGPVPISGKGKGMATKKPRKGRR